MALEGHCPAPGGHRGEALLGQGWGTLQGCCRDRRWAQRGHYSPSSPFLLPRAGIGLWRLGMGEFNSRLGGVCGPWFGGWLRGALPPSQAPFHPCSFSHFILPSLTLTYSFSPLTPPFSCPIPAPTSSFPCFLRLPKAMRISSLLSSGIPNQALFDSWVKHGEAETQPQAGVRAQECPAGLGRPGPAQGSFTPSSVSHSAELWLAEFPGNFRC